MKICWCSEIKENTNSCRLFLSMEKAINTIKEEMENNGFIINISKNEYNNTIMNCIANKEGSNFSLMWLFSYIEVEDS